MDAPPGNGTGAPGLRPAAAAGVFRPLPALPHSIRPQTC
ncbi:hypothetical protein Z950_1273 [Sulfitobacter mediterraneus KCTC 32188]|nr:hypothetical protein Z950_1273 [Sulfitobacter mediterraneus KCTC 32188]